MPWIRFGLIPQFPMEVFLMENMKDAIHREENVYTASQQPETGKEYLELVYPLPLHTSQHKLAIRVPDLLSPSECNFLRDLAIQHYDAGEKWGKFLDFTYIKVEEAEEIYRKIAHEIIQNNPWQLSLSGIYEHFCVIRYPEGKGQRMHTDFNPAELDPSKLSFVARLSPDNEYAGGTLHIADEPFHLKQGEGIFFPSYMIHHVSRVTSGERWVLAGWASGPSFV